MSDTRRPPKIAAHRGLSARYPENTLSAFEAARRAGVQWIETDVSMLKDETLILFHDEVQGRTVRGDKLVSEAVWSDFAAADAGVWKAPEFAGETVLVLADFLRWAHSHEMSVNLEMKCHGGRRTQTARRLASVLQQCPLADIVVSSFDLAFLQTIGRLMPDLRLASIHSQWPAGLNKQTDGLGLEAVHLDHQLITGPRDITRLHDQGLAVRAWTVNDPGRAALLFDWGVDMVMSDCPDRLF